MMCKARACCEQVLKTLLEVGARPDAKDQEESAALHIAAL